MKYSGPERRQPQNGILKTWQFLAGLIVIFIALASFWRTESNDFTQYAYPRERGIFMEKTLDDLNKTLHETNDVLTQLRITMGEKGWRQHEVQ